MTNQNDTNFAWNYSCPSPLSGKQLTASYLSIIFVSWATLKFVQTNVSSNLSIPRRNSCFENGGHCICFQLILYSAFESTAFQQKQVHLEYLAAEIPFLHFHIFLKFLSYFRWCHRVCLNGNYWNTFLCGITTVLNNWQPLSYVMSPSGIFHFMLASA